MEFLIVLVVLAIVVLIVTGPLRRSPRAGEEGEGAGADGVIADVASSGARRAGGESSSSAIAELEAERAAKYREIRDAELDHRTGKLSDADYEAVDQTLRAEAVEILHQLDREGGADPNSPGKGAPDQRPESTGEAGPDARPQPPTGEA